MPLQVNTARVDEVGSFASACLFQRRLRRVLHRFYIATVDLDSGHAETPCAFGQVCAYHRRRRGREAKRVVLADEQDGKSPHHSQVHGLQQHALVCRTFAKKRHSGRLRPQVLSSQGKSRRRRARRANDSGRRR